MDMPLLRVRSLVTTAQFSALIAVGGLFTLPLGPVPFTLQTLFVYLAGLYLGARRAACAVLVYLSAGLMGLPVFAGGKAGIGVLFGPTAGYLAGFVCAAVIAGFAGSGEKSTWKAALGLALAVISLHTCGMLGLLLIMGLPPAKVLAIGLPFLPVDVCKSGAAFAIWRYLAARGFTLS